MGIFDKKHGGEKVDETADLPAYERDHSLDVEDGLFENADQLRRRLGNRQIQLIAIGGSIGTALFGPGSLFLAYFIYSCMLGLVNNCMAEMTILMPVSGGFIRMAGHWVDDALGFMAGWNFFFYEALLIPFEVTALNSVLGFAGGKLGPPSTASDLT
ncbi:hypothetical protein LTR35_010329 [Friedmanniomyces endolithicus]|nr:hypothetical protein LTS00_016394 [Friedmanniomyces endolithicus]KAK0276935.1 hypothetical protein LTR35_010329 [Friedmanniomyces endolithicus]KAK0992015.1 hypothetical protein LTR54_011521 [Friedmanniomyces endolithicus]